MSHSNQVDKKSSNTTWNVNGIVNHDVVHFGGNQVNGGDVHYNGAGLSRARVEEIQVETQAAAIALHELYIRASK
ncbi:hypothetical protein HWV62_11902 [Athelia sp. TMB]|nr:hypothetical protein HWV62_11902 [Athelia sp. TMB]